MSRNIVAKVRKCVDDCYDIIHTNIRNCENIIIRKMLLPSKDILLIKKNKELKNLYRGQRCFVLGNGPSLNTEDLTQLQNEYVFTVNQCMRRSDFKDIKTNFHFWADPIFYNSDMSKAENIEMLDVFRRVNAGNSNPKCFIPIAGKKFVLENHLDKIADFYYFYPSQAMYPGMKKDFKFESNAPAFGTVVQYCIAMAIYMGFTQIYVLGIDGTGIITNINSALKNDVSKSYGYEMTLNEKKRLQAMMENSSIEAFVRTYLQELVGYRYLREYCEKRGIELVNCSSHSAIQALPKRSLESVLKNNENDQKESK